MNTEAGTTVWFAMRTAPTTFWIVDAFPGESERRAHIEGPIAAALMAACSAPRRRSCRPRYWRRRSPFRPDRAGYRD